MQSDFWLDADHNTSSTDDDDDIDPDMIRLSENPDINERGKVGVAILM